MVAPALARLLEIMVQLRDPRRGCPWDRRQTFGSLVPFTLEEAYEVADAAERRDLEALREELGDLLFHVVFYAQLAAESGHFSLHDVIAEIAEKLERRHPHVFGDAPVGSAAAQSAAWEAHKADERRARGGTGFLHGVALALPALTRAVKLQHRAAQAGFDWPGVAQVVAKVVEELEEVREEVAEGAAPHRLEHEIGDVLLAVTNLARHLSVDPEAALRRANQRFERRFQRMEALAQRQGRAFAEASPAEMDAWWEKAKAEESR